ncbi:cartilage intermediate layer protein 2-like [Epinephelus moara]|uniref:cartilage intermediate layer protein 2-like n=1 Tax=Epinephelus moara TaxID=300413 RepID=UPI00214F0725|nr:cartilage intermediate layer protein 2-like [Epinephelus moara]
MLPAWGAHGSGDWHDWDWDTAKQLIFDESNQQSYGVPYAAGQTYSKHQYFGRRCWTDWFDRDNPSGTGDWENLSNLRKENPGKICAKPLDIEARTLLGLSPAAAGEIIHKSDTTSGFICRNEDQCKKKGCSDYRVRFSCPISFCDGGGPRPKCWTDWFDRDDPSGNGDWENLSNLLTENPWKICSKPLGIQARTLSGLSAAEVGDVIYK